MKTFQLVLVLSIFTAKTHAACTIRTAHGTAEGLGDVLFATLTAQATCPQNVFELKDTLIRDGVNTLPSMVANRGRQNPKLGSFSFFEVGQGHSASLDGEIGPGHLYFGHFTGASQGVVDLDQAPAPGKLMVELIAWDFEKGMYNFYELIGTANGATWFYRGDSSDAFEDNQALHLQKNPAKPVFGKTMRCSGCHTSGGPIMKELEAPHNDWWVKGRPLPLGFNNPSPAMKQWLFQTVDASEFATNVKAGMELLEKSPAYQDLKKSLSLPEQLRTLFCTQEINLVSDAIPFRELNDTISIPSDYFVNPLLVSKTALTMKKADYREALLDFGFRFPEIEVAIDADHAWLAPVKGHSDLLAIESLVKSGLIDDEFVADVLAIDLETPLFSTERCGLLRFVPQSEQNWKAELLTALLASSSPVARELAANVKDPAKTATFHQAAALRYLKGISMEADAVKNLVLDLDAKRHSVFTNEISKNPMGQILEPGFRVIFPERR